MEEALMEQRRRLLAAQHPTILAFAREDYCRNRNSHAVALLSWALYRLFV